MTKYEIITRYSYRVIATGFKTREGAQGWADAHDWGQWEEEGGVRVVAYEATKED